MRLSFEEFVNKYKDCEFDITESGHIQVMPNKVWKPNKDEGFYFINSSGKVEYYHSYNNNFDHTVWSIGNVFKTEEEAKEAIELLKVIKILRDYGGRGYQPNKDNFTCHHLHEGGWEIKSYTCDVSHPMSIFFDDFESLNKAMKAVGNSKLVKYIL